MVVLSQPRYFRPDIFFDLTTFAYRDLFDHVRNVWEVLPRLEAYIREHAPAENCVRGHVHPGAYLVGEHILIEEDALIEFDAFIQGPCIIGRGSIVRHGAYVRSGTLVGAGSLIGHEAETKNALLLPGSRVAQLTFVGDSILGNRVSLGAGTKLANWRLDGRTICIHAGGQLYSSGLDKMGAVIGDDSQLGCNTVCNPGTILGPRCRVYPLTSVHGYHPAGTVLRAAWSRIR
jgi:NDP-sugar pyrophosphorylase family protein